MTAKKATKKAEVFPEPNCSFCGKGPNDVNTIVSGPCVFICDECISLCDDILAAQWLGPDVLDGIGTPLDRLPFSDEELADLTNPEASAKFKAFCRDRYLGHIISRLLATLELRDNALKIIRSVLQL